MILDKKYRKDLRENPHKLLQLNTDIEVIVKTNEKNKFYLVLNKNANFNLNDLNAAGAKAGSIGSISSLGTFSSSPLSALSTASSLGTVGSVMPT